jgi:HD-GYP domain-containing protein (c-di-GMP phosphodiesterase class II)
VAGQDSGAATSATGGSARSEAAAIDPRRWQARPALAFTVASLTIIGPFLAAFVAVELSTRLVPRPATMVPFLLWLAMLCVISTAALRIVDRYARRLLPLATMLRLTLAFPDRAPSRFALALRSGSGRALQRAVDAENAEEEYGTPQPAAERVLALLAAMNRHDRFTRGHSERVRAYADLLGRQLELDEASVAKLHWAALLHDVGKLDVAPDILTKKGKLTDAEWEVMREHPAHSNRWLRPLVPWLGEWALAATEHHERYDGDGYPNGVSGEQISLAGRIVAVADAFDVMTSARSYKKPLPAEQARVELTDNAGTQFDPHIVRAFLEISLDDLYRVMGPVAWLAAVPALLRSTLAGLVAPMQSIAGATGIIAVSLIPALAAPIQADAAAPTNGSALDGGHMSASGTVAAPGTNDDGDGKPSAPHKSRSGSSASTPGSTAKSSGGADTVTTPTSRRTAGAPPGSSGIGTAAPSSGTSPPSGKPKSGKGSGNSGPGGGHGNSGPGGGNPGPGGSSTTTTTTTTTTTVPKPTTTTTAPKHPPVAVDDTTSVLLGTWLNINVLGNDTDLDGNLNPGSLKVVARSDALTRTNGTNRAVIRVVNGVFSFRLQVLVGGPKWFDYRVCDTSGLCDTARVTVTLLP